MFVPGFKPDPETGRLKACPVCLFGWALIAAFLVTIWHAARKAKAA